MSTSLGRFVRTLREAARGPLGAERDGDLLRRFVEERDEAAFESLVGRHGPMVLSVCLRILRNGPDADDAFQACFIVLLRKAPSIRSADTLANWLFGVAQRTALEARRARERQRAREAQAKPRQEEQADGLREVLDLELARLPEKYREVLVLCDLEEHSRKEAAALLGLEEGTVASRLARGRALLAERLRKHRVQFTAGPLVACAAVPPALLKSTLACAAAVPPPVAGLAEGVLKGMAAARLGFLTWIAVGLLLVAGGIGLGAFLLARAPLPPGVVREKAAPPDVWEMAFERDLAADFRHGRWTDVGLPRGSRGAAVAVPVDRGDEGIFYQITVPRPRGPLFTVHADTHLHFTYRMDRPNWLNVFLIACRRDGSHSSNYLFKDLDHSRREAGKWRTASIPVSLFARLNADGVVPWKAESPHLVLFSAPAPDRGLVVDRVWVTRGGPGAVRYQVAD